jgi:hypothetical protein
MFLTVIMQGISKVVTISDLMKVYTIPCHDRGHNVMLVLQSCKDSLQIMAGSNADTFPTSSVWYI